MKIFSCYACKSEDVFMRTNGNQIGLYCGDCGKWIKWLNKDEIRLVDRQIIYHDEEHDKEVRRKFAEWLCNKTEYTHIEVDKIGIYSDDYKLTWKPIDEVLEEYEKR